LLDAATQERLGGRQCTDFIGEDAHQLGLRIRAAVGQAMLQVMPDAFIWIKLGGVRREWLHVQAGGTGKQLFNRIAAMRLAVIQQHDQMAGYLAQQMAEEEGHVVALNIVLIQVAVQRTMHALGADGNARDGGDPIVTIAMMH